jgi:hypothetical protein
MTWASSTPPWSNYQQGSERAGTLVPVINDLFALDSWLTGIRLIVRREPLRPWTQTTLFPSDTFRYWDRRTDTAEDLGDLDVEMGAHAYGPHPPAQGLRAPGVSIRRRPTSTRRR